MRQSVRLYSEFVLVHSINLFHPHKEVEYVLLCRTDEERELSRYYVIETLAKIRLGTLGLIIIRWSVRPIVALARSLVFRFEVTFYPSF